MGTFNRRTVLRGLMGGGVVTLGLPLFDCFLNTNGTALASGAPLPLRFGTWFWGCGMNVDRWVPKKTGADYDLPPELKAMAPYKQHVSILSGYRMLLDGAANEPHISGIWTLRTGDAPRKRGDGESPSFDVLVSDAIGQGSRFRSLDVSASGDKRQTYSRRNGATLNPSEGSPLALYSRIFGEEFQDPNKGVFTPDPKIVLRKSAISAVLADTKDVTRELGAADKVRFDQYLTALRQLENQLALQLEKPAPAEACIVPGKVTEATVGADIDDVLVNHKLMTKLIAMALACNQTKAFNIVFSEGGSSLRKKGVSDTHHTLTHNEPVNDQGFQTQSTWFVERSMQGWADFLEIMTSFKEGDGCLLDNMHVNAQSDTSLAKVHSLDNIPMMFAGKAGGRIKTGMHIAGNGDPVSRVVLTSLRVMGLSAAKYGTRSMETSKPVTEIMV